MLRDLTSVTLDSSFGLIYAAVAAGIGLGAVLGVAAIWLSVAVRGGTRQ